MSTLLQDIETFIASNEALSDSQFGVLAVNDKNLVRDLREGRDVRLSTVEKVRTFMREWRPPESDAAPDTKAA